jgi:hypothetical protein
MKILVLADNEAGLGNKWSELWEMLDGAKQAGVTWSKHLFNSKEDLTSYDAYIFIDILNPNYYGKPFIEISSLEDDTDKLTEKVQSLASYMFGEITWEAPPWAGVYEKDEIRPDFEIDVADLGYQVTPEEVAKLTIKKFIVSIEGKDVALEHSDLVALGKVANLMDKFGYRVKKVIV